MLFANTLITNENRGPFNIKASLMLFKVKLLPPVANLSHFRRAHVQHEDRIP